MIEARKPVLELRGLAAWLERNREKIAANKLARKPQALALLRRELARTMAQSFLSFRAPTGERWKPLAYRRGTPLWLTGNLHQTAVEGIKQARIQSGQHFQVWLHMAPYGAFHQFGTRRIPRRAFFGLSAQGIAAVGQGILSLAVNDLTRRD